MEYTHLGRLGLVVSRLTLGTMNFGPHSTEGRQPRDHGRGHRARRQLLRHRERVRTSPGRRSDRGDHRPLVREGRRPAREGRAGEQGLRADGRLAERGAPVRARDPQGVRGVAQAAAHRPHRPVSDAPHRPRRVVERGLAGDGAARAAGQDPLRRLEQLRGLAYRARQRDRAVRGTSSAWRRSRACTTSARAPSSWRSCPRSASTAWGSSRTARCPAGCWPARCPRSRRGVVPASTCRARSRSIAISSGDGSCSAASSANGPPTSRSRGCWRSRASRRRSSDRARPTSCNASMRALEIHLDDDVLKRARRDLPGSGRRLARGLRLVAERPFHVECGGHDGGRVTLRPSAPEP